MGIGVRRLDPASIVIVIINVDAPFGQPLADMLMPGFDWQQFRDRGLKPCARGLAKKDAIVEYVKIFDEPVAEYIKKATDPVALVIDYGTAIAFTV